MFVIVMFAVTSVVFYFLFSGALVQGTLKAEASILTNEVQQLSSAYNLYKDKNKGIAPINVQELVIDGQLKSIPGDWVIGSVNYFENSAPGEVCQYVATQENGIGCFDTVTGDKITAIVAKANPLAQYDVKFPM